MIIPKITILFSLFQQSHLNDRVDAGYFLSNIDHSYLIISRSHTTEMLLYCSLTCVFIIAICFGIVVASNLWRRKSQRLSGQQFSNNIRRNMNAFTAFLAEASTTNLLDPLDAELTDRHREIIDRIVKGKTNKEIGEELYISENTVKYHVKAIFKMMGVENRSALKKRATTLKY